MQNRPSRLSEILETHYSGPSQQLTRLIHRYSILYNLPRLAASFELSAESFATMPEDIGFALVAAYDSRGRIAIKNSSSDKSYSFTGPHLFGGAVEKLSSYCLEEAASAIASAALGAEVLELEPIAIVQNTFVHGQQRKEHYGIAFAAFVGAPIANLRDIFWTQERPVDLIFQNSAVFDLVIDYIKDRHIAVPIAEALSGNRGTIKRLVHHYLVRPIIHSGSSKKIRRRIKANIEKCESYLDISAGDDDFIIEISEEYDPSVVIANDISWPAMKAVRTKSSSHNYNIIFTNHNLCDLPFNIQFEVVLWKNTLHHVASLEEMIHALDCVSSIAKKLIIVDIEDPRRSRRGRLWNYYYEHFYGDADEDHHFFFTRSSFRNLIDAAFAGKRTEFETIRTLKGNYLLAAIDLVSQA